MSKIIFPAFVCCCMCSASVFAQDIAFDGYAAHQRTYTSASAAADDPETARLKLATRLQSETDASLSADFQPNKGQWRSLAMFRMTQDDHSAQFFSNGVEFGETIKDKGAQRAYLWGFNFIRADKWVRMEAKYPSGGTNYAVGKDRTAFVASHRELWYENLYNGIDLRFYGADKTSFFFDFVLQPEAVLTHIQLHLNGVQAWNIDEEGELDVEFDENYSRHFTVTAFQYTSSGTQSVGIRFKKTSEGQLGYDISSGYDNAKPLIIRQM